MEHYLNHTERSFDEIAGTFDEEDSANEILQWMRHQIYEVYLRYFHEGDHLLELNAGTGLDAVYLASQGIRVCATDISSGMLEKLNKKIIANDLNELITVFNLSFDEISGLQLYDFDGVISNFGGLNCINDFRGLSESLAARVKKGGKFIAAVINSFCPWEILYYTLKLDLANAFRRFNRNGIDAGLSRFRIKTFYYNPREFARHFEKHFQLEKVFALGMFTPPPYLYGIYRRIPSAVKVMMKADSMTKGLLPFNRAGDHFIVVMKRR